MAQGILPFKYEAERKTTGMTALAGLPAYLDLLRAMGLSKSINKHLKVRAGGQGWTDSQMVMSLVLLNLAGGDCVEDIRMIEADDGFCEVLKKSELHGLRQKARCALLRRWRKDRTRTVPSASAIFRYLSAFHDAEQEQLRRPGKAFIPAPNEHLRGFVGINKDMLSFTNRQECNDTATLDMDATLIGTSKAAAFYSYKGYRAYQPLNVWWSEREVVLHTEFRDGNVPADCDLLRVFKEALGNLPEGVKGVRFRSDAAGYEHALLKYCATGGHARFGVIEFAVGCYVTKEYKRAVAAVPEADWKRLYRIVDGRKQETGLEWAEVCFVPNKIGHSKKGPAYRYLATRERLEVQDVLPGMEEQLSFPFATMDVDGRRYRIYGIVTNMDWDAAELIHWFHKRCGKSEAAHGVMKDDLAGGKLPSEDFGENAAWWWIMILALNLNSVMKRLVWGTSWVSKRMKAIRFSLIRLPGRVIQRSRSLLIRLTRNHPSLELLLEARRKIALLRPVPSG